MKWWPFKTPESRGGDDWRDYAARRAQIDAAIRSIPYVSAKDIERREANALDWPEIDSSLIPMKED